MWESHLANYPEHKLKNTEIMRSKLQPLELCNIPVQVTGKVCVWGGGMEYSNTGGGKLACGKIGAEILYV